MKEIILVRHAKVDIEGCEPIFASEMAAWVEAYDKAPIDAESKPSQEVLHAIKAADILLTSRLPRTITSAVLTGKGIDASEACFNEAAVPEVHIPFMKLSPRSWLSVLRFLLLAGLGNKDASLQSSKKRAKEATIRLLQYTQTCERVVLIGHGGMNWLIKKELLKQGWELSGKPSHRNWGMTRLVMPRKVQS